MEGEFYSHATSLLWKQIFHKDESFLEEKEIKNGLVGLLTVRMWRLFGDGARFGEKIEEIQVFFYDENVAWERI
jgi:hypothetical protein